MSRPPGACARLLLIAFALSAGGCGGGAHHPGPGGSSASRSGAAPGSGAGAGTGASGEATGPYRWLIRTSGPQPSIAAENRQPGTRAWRLPGPAAYVGGLAHGPISAYVASQALAPGQTERVYVNDRRSGFVRIRIFRMGWYGGKGGREVLRSARLRTQPQPACSHRSHTGLTECRWHATLSFVVPPGLASGVYIAKLSTNSGDQSDCLFVVSSTNPTPLLAQLPSATYEAYNAWGGNSLYPGGGDEVGVTGARQGVEVSYDRPYDSVTGAGEFFARGDVSLVRFLEHYGYPVSYTDSEAVDRNPSTLAGHHVLLDLGHSEYWSQRQAGAWRHARDGGTNLVFLGSDTLAWRVRFAPAGTTSSEAGAPGHVMLAYKEHAALDPHRAEPSGAFPDYGAALTGSAYVGCITPRVPRAGPPRYRYYPWSPGRLLRPAWLFAHTGVTPSTVIPGITGYELDEVTTRSPANTIVIGRGRAACMPVGASAHAEPSPGSRRQLADTTLYTASSGALVFSSGTLGWELGLGSVPSASPDAPLAADPRVVGMTKNLLEHLLR